MFYDGFEWFVACFTLFRFMSILNSIVNCYCNCLRIRMIVFFVVVVVIFFFILFLGSVTVSFRWWIRLFIVGPLHHSCIGDTQYFRQIYIKYFEEREANKWNKLWLSLRSLAWLLLFAQMSLIPIPILIPYM